MSEMIVNDATVIEGLEACFFDDDFVQTDSSRGKESTAGRWTHAEHEMFVKGLEAHSKQWKLIAELIKTRTVVQVRTHAQKYFQKLLKQAKNDGTNINEEAFADIFNDSSSDFSAGLKRKNSNGFPSKNKVKRTDSTSSLSMEACPTRAMSESELRVRNEGDKKRKIKSDRPNSPSPRSVTDCAMEPYLNSYPIQMSNGSSYPQNNITTEGNATADWFNLGQPQTAASGPIQSQAPRYQQLNAPATSNYTTAPAFGGSDPSQMGYTHGMDCNANTALYYQSQTYPNALPQNNISHHIQQMDFPDPFGIGGGDLNGLDLCWLVDDMDLPDSAAEAYSSNRGPSAFESREVSHAQAPCTTPAHTERAMSISGESRTDMNVGQETAQKAGSTSSAFNVETSSAFGSSEAYTSYEESSLTSCTSSDDGCYDEFEVSPSHDQSIGDAMAVITNSQRRRLSKSSLALNNMYNTSTDSSFNMCDILAVEEKQITSQHQSQNLSNTSNLNLENGGWFRGDDEDLVLVIVEAFSS